MVGGGKEGEKGEEEKEEEEEEKQTNTVFDVWYRDGTLSNIGCQNHLHNN